VIDLEAAMEQCLPFVGAGATVGSGVIIASVHLIR